ncbi:hypothetical protein NQ176_g10652 [Zarea fungicola]|uniref:Uncharacterized protein n=1 Tax=Zarea fungicola TaxID=93591 RepID=A0ACC1MFE9_9HYPO|nr:hypothetical protein NQ176_g10652 [Lecanicillium fungicola]
MHRGCAAWILCIASLPLYLPESSNSQLQAGECGAGSPTRDIISNSCSDTTTPTNHVSISQDTAGTALLVYAAHTAAKMLRIGWIVRGVPNHGLPADAIHRRDVWDIFSKLLQERIICLNGEVNDYMSASIVAQLLWLESDTPDKPITMYINSPGGSVTSGSFPPDSCPQGTKDCS